MLIDASDLGVGGVLVQQDAHPLEVLFQETKHTVEKVFCFGKGNTDQGSQLVC